MWSKHLRSLVALLILVVFTACEASTPYPTVTPTPPPTPEPTATATPEPLGAARNPLVMGVVLDAAAPQIQSAADKLAQSLSKTSGLSIAAKTYATSAELMDALKAGQIHLTWLQPFSYIYAKKQGWVEPALLTNHFGVYQYGALFLSNASSGFTLYFDPKSNNSTTDAAAALKQLKDKRPCWVEPQSGSGYLLPLGLLIGNNIEVKTGAFLQSHSAVIRALYITGICDFGVTFAYLGDPRTGSAVQKDLTDVMNRVVVLWQSDAVIPNLNLSLRVNVPRNTQRTLITAVQDLVKTADGKNTLTAALNYDVQDVQPVTDKTYDSLRYILETTKTDPASLLGR